MQPLAMPRVRYDTADELAVLNDLYLRLRLFTNYFQPVMKLVEKTRVGSRTTKKHDAARTPYGRVLTSHHIAKNERQFLCHECRELNPEALARDIKRLLERLDSVSERKVEAKDTSSVWSTFPGEATDTPIECFLA